MYLAAQTSQTRSTGTGYVCLFAFLVFTALVLGLCLVWLNIERVDMAYDMRRLGKQYDEKAMLTAKLEIERENLMAPQRLRRLARELGLAPARTGQIRKVRPAPTTALATTLSGTPRENPETAKEATENGQAAQN